MKILNCKIFNKYINKEYKIITKHKIFGENKMQSVINDFIDDEERVGIMVHGKELYCYKKNGICNIVEENDIIILSDDMMKIFISF